MKELLNSVIWTNINSQNFKWKWVRLQWHFFKSEYGLGRSFESPHIHNYRWSRWSLHSDWDQIPKWNSLFAINGSENPTNYYLSFISVYHFEFSSALHYSFLIQKVTSSTLQNLNTLNVGDLNIRVASSKPLEKEEFLARLKWQVS